jgi:hypothetical protein
MCLRWGFCCDPELSLGCCVLKSFYLVGVTAEQVRLGGFLKCGVGYGVRVSLLQGHYELWRGLCIVQQI